MDTSNTLPQWSEANINIYGEYGIKEIKYENCVKTRMRDVMFISAGICFSILISPYLW